MVQVLEKAGDVVFPAAAPGNPSVAFRQRLVHLVLIFSLLFAACIATVLPDGGATRLDVADVPANARNEIVVARLGKADTHGYLQTGYDIAETRGIPRGTPRYTLDRFNLDIWPPGMPFYYALLFTIFGPKMPVGVVAGMTMALLWALLLTAYVDLLTRAWPWTVVATMLGVLFVSDIVRDWILGSGVLWSEGLYTWCMLAALYAAARLALARSNARALSWAGGVGLLLGLSAYVRAVSDLFGRVMLALLVGWTALVLVRLVVRRRAAAPKPGRVSAGQSWPMPLLALLVCALAFQAVTVPWRIYASRSIRPGSYAWSTGSDFEWRLSWMPDRYLAALNLQWLVEGGANTACKVEPRTCARIAAYELRQPAPYSGRGRYTTSRYRELTIRSAVDHPIDFATDRLEHLRTAWFWKPTLGLRTELLQNALLLLVVIAAVVLSVRRMRLRGPDLLALFVPGLAVVGLAPFVFVHFEARYFIPLKLVSVVAVFLLVALDPWKRKLDEAPASALDDART